MGLNNDGAETVANRLAESSVLGLSGNTTGMTRLGINITKTPDPSIEGSEAVSDFVKSFNFMKNINGINWITLNISCPNTAEGKTFEDPSALTDLLAGLRDQTHSYHMPLHLKMAPIASSGQWLDSALATFAIARRFNVEAIVIANTVPDRSFGLKSDPDLVAQRGGLSGPPIFERSIPMIKEAFKQGMTVVGVGGVSNGKDAYRLIRSGASLIQLYTAIVFDGPTVFRDIENELERLLIIDGFTKVHQVIGIDVARDNVSFS
jgi:dihydroorotate dehydrogenase